MAGKYEAEGKSGWTQLWENRRKVYSGAMVLGGVLIATGVFVGAFTLQDVENFRDIAVEGVAILAGVYMLMQAALAKAHPAKDEDED